MKTIHTAEVNSIRPAVSDPQTRRREFRKDFFA